MKIILVMTFLLALGITADAQVTVYLAGDSTCAKKAEDKRPETGWGEMLQQYFDPAKASTVNEAQNGRSTKSFIDEGRWQSMVARLKKGDWVLIQFGHNDEKKDKPAVYASPEDYKKNLVKFINDARSKEATPVLLTPVSRRKFENGVLIKTHGEYPAVVTAVGQEKHVTVIDMESRSSAVINRYGERGSTQLFLQLMPGENPNYPDGVTDNTHFSPLGAEEVAKALVKELTRSKLKLSKYLKDAIK